MRITGKRSPERAWLVVAAGALLLGGPVWQYLYVNRYPFTRPEAIVLPLVGAALGIGLLLIGRRLGGVLETLIFAAVLYVFVDIQFDLDPHFRAVTLVVACIVLSQLFRSRRAAITCITLASFYLAALPRPRSELYAESSPGSAQDRSLPLLVHIILDEQWGTGGLRAAGDTATASFLEEFYATRGFELYAAAYSRWSYTARSILEVLSLGEVHTVDNRPHRRRPHQNAYFEYLLGRGYRIKVYQNGYMDFCHTPGVVVAACTEASANSIANIAYFDGPWLRRGLMNGRFFLNVNSHIYNRLVERTAPWRRSMAGGGLHHLRLMRDELNASPQEGTAFFAHLLLPHRPLEADSSCHIQARVMSHRVGYGRPRSDSALQVHKRLYGDQVRCAHRALGELLAAVDRTVGRDRAIVIVHGDHGSRLTPLGDAKLVAGDEESLNAHFSTLLAIRRPGFPGRIHTEPLPVQDFLWHVISTGFEGGDAGGWRHYVRARAFDREPSDTLRELSPDRMAWVRAAQSSPGVRWAGAALQ